MRFRETDDPRSGTPESITLTVLETDPTDIGNLHFVHLSAATSMFISRRIGSEDVIMVHRTVQCQTPLFHAVFNHDEATEDWLSASDWPTIVTTEEVTGVTNLTPVLLEESTQLMKGEPRMKRNEWDRKDTVQNHPHVCPCSFYDVLIVVTKAPSMEAFEETMTLFPDEGEQMCTSQKDRVGESHNKMLECD